MDGASHNFEGRWSVMLHPQAAGDRQARRLATETAIGGLMVLVGVVLLVVDLLPWWNGVVFVVLGATAIVFYGRWLWWHLWLERHRGDDA